MLLLVARPATVLCRCGHAQIAHLHYRPGTDCAMCECARFRRGRTLRALRRLDPRRRPSGGSDS